MEALYEVIEWMFSIILMVMAGLWVWSGEFLISERKARYKAGTHDYYDNPIEKEKNGED